MLGEKSNTEIVVVANQRLIQLEAYTMRGSPSLTLPEGFKPRGWTANRPRIEPCMIGKRGEKSMKSFIMILCYTHGSLPSSIFNRKASPRSWCKQVDTQPNIVQGKPMEEGEEGLWKPEGQGQDWKLHRINLSGFMGLMETEPPTRELAYDWPGPSVHVLHLCALVFLWDLWQRLQKLSDSVAWSWVPFLLLG